LENNRLGRRLWTGAGLNSLEEVWLFLEIIVLSLSLYRRS
jgi:hypothetical protein